MARPIEVTDENFGELVLEASLPTLVDFWAIWCKPCKMIAPIVEELAEEYDGRLQVAKLDVDSNPQTAIELMVMSIPTLILFKGGQPAEQITGFWPKAQIVEKITPHL